MQQEGGIHVPSLPGQRYLDRRKRHHERWRSRMVRKNRALAETSKLARIEDRKHLERPQLKGEIIHGDSNHQK
jgi:hypothetical protein